MKRYLVLTGSLSAIKYKVFASFQTEDCEDLKLYETIQEAMNEAAIIRRKWSYLHVFVIELHIKIHDTTAKVIYQEP